MVGGLTTFTLAVHDGHQFTVLEDIILKYLGAEVEDFLAVALKVQALLRLEIHPEQDLQVSRNGFPFLSREPGQLLQISHESIVPQLQP